MPSATTTEQLLFAWGVWSRLDSDVGPTVARAAASLEGGYRSPQPWDDDARRRPRLLLLDDETAMKVEKCVLGTGVVLAAALRSFYIRLYPPRTRAQVQLLLEAQRRVGVLLGTPGCATGPSERPRSVAAEGRATRTSPEPF